MSLRLERSPNLALRTRRPAVTVDGTHVPAEWGRVEVDLSPGTHQIEIAMHPTRRWGVGTVTVHARPGETVVLYYAAPYGFRHPGRIGTVPQAHAGAGLFYGGLAVCAVLFLTLFLLAVR